MIYKIVYFSEDHYQEVKAKILNVNYDNGMILVTVNNREKKLLADDILEVTPLMIA